MSGFVLDFAKKYGIKYEEALEEVRAKTSDRYIAFKDDFDKIQMERLKKVREIQARATADKVAAAKARHSEAALSEVDSSEVDSSETVSSETVSSEDSGEKEAKALSKVLSKAEQKKEELERKKELSKAAKIEEAERKKAEAALSKAAKIEEAERKKAEAALIKTLSKTAKIEEAERKKAEAALSKALSKAGGSSKTSSKAGGSSKASSKASSKKSDSSKSGSSSKAGAKKRARTVVDFVDYEPEHCDIPESTMRYLQIALYFLLNFEMPLDISRLSEVLTQKYLVKIICRLREKALSSASSSASASASASASFGIDSYIETMRQRYYNRPVILTDLSNEFEGEMRFALWALKTNGTIEEKFMLHKTPVEIANHVVKPAGQFSADDLNSHYDFENKSVFSTDDGRSMDGRSMDGRSTEDRMSTDDRMSTAAADNNSLHDERISQEHHHSFDSMVVETMFQGKNDDDEDDMDIVSIMTGSHHHDEDDDEDIFASSTRANSCTPAAFAQEDADAADADAFVNNSHDNFDNYQLDEALMDSLADSPPEIRKIYKVASKEILQRKFDENPFLSDKPLLTRSLTPSVKPNDREPQELKEAVKIASFEMELMNQLRIYNENVAGLISLLRQKRPLQ